MQHLNTIFCTNNCNNKPTSIHLNTIFVINSGEICNLRYVFICRILTSFEEDEVRTSLGILEVDTLILQLHFISLKNRFKPNPNRCSVGKNE